MPPTLLEVRYTFEDAPPTRVVGRQAYYELESIDVWLNGVEYPALPLEIMVENGLRYAPGVRRDGYFVGGVVSGSYDSTFELLAAGLSFEKYGNRPQALDDLGLPTSTEELSGFTVEGPMDQRSAWLSFENLATGGQFSNHARLTSFSIVPVTEPGALAWLGLGLMWSVLGSLAPVAQASVTRSPKSSSAASFVSKCIGSARAWAIKMRSKGSRWMGGRPKTSAALTVISQIEPALT